LYSLTDSKIEDYPKSITVYSMNAAGSNNFNGTNVKLSKSFNDIYFKEVEKGGAGIFSLPDNRDSFVQFKTTEPIKAAGLIFGINGYGVTNVKYLDKVERVPIETDERAAEMYYGEWNNDYKNAYGKDFNARNDKVFGRPGSILDAVNLVSFDIKELDCSGIISKWETRSVANHGYICFVVDIFKNCKIVNSFRYSHQFGAL